MSQEPESKRPESPYAMDTRTHVQFSGRIAPYDIGEACESINDTKANVFFTMHMCNKCTKMPIFGFRASCRRCRSVFCIKCVTANQFTLGCRYCDGKERFYFDPLLHRSLMACSIAYAQACTIFAQFVSVDLIQRIVRVAFGEVSKELVFWHASPPQILISGDLLVAFAAALMSIDESCGYSQEQMEHDMEHQFKDSSYSFSRAEGDNLRVNVSYPNGHVIDINTGKVRIILSFNRAEPVPPAKRRCTSSSALQAEALGTPSTEAD